MVLSSRLIPRQAFTNATAPKLLDAVSKGLNSLVNKGISSSYQIILAPPSRVNNSQMTSVNPIWYDSLWHVIYAGLSSSLSLALALSPVEATNLILPNSAKFQPVMPSRPRQVLPRSITKP